MAAGSPLEKKAHVTATNTKTHMLLPKSTLRGRCPRGGGRSPTPLQHCSTPPHSAAHAHTCSSERYTQHHTLRLWRDRGPILQTHACARIHTHTQWPARSTCGEDAQSNQRSQQTADALPTAAAAICLLRAPQTSSADTSSAAANSCCLTHPHSHLTLNLTHVIHTEDHHEFHRHRRSMTHRLRLRAPF